MNRIIILAAFLLSAMMAFGQKLLVESFEYLPKDLTARTSPRNDRNGTPCAVIRVGIALQGVVFDGNTIGNSVFNTGEYLVYMPEGSRQITIRHNSYVPLTVVFADYGIDKVESSYTYRLTILTGGGVPVVQQAQGNFLVMNVIPATARVSIDNGESTVADSDGSFKIYLNNGTHSYRVEAGNAYSPVSGTVEMKGERITLPITLQSVKASLSIKATTSGSKIYVNEDYKGIDQWQGELPPGTYLIEAKKDGYRSYSTTVSLAKQQSKTITIPPLQASYGMLMVDYKPVDADVYIDNTLIGKAPNVFSKVLSGQHNLKISKAGYQEYTTSVTIHENQQTSLRGSLSKNNSESNISSVNNSSVSGSVVPITVKGVTFNMIKVVGGTFTMGATSEQKNPYDDEKPAHKVTLSSYYIGETEVTQALWKAVMGNTVRDQQDKANISWSMYGEGDNYPMYYVSWDECQDFINKLNELTNRRFRLPTEAEWEFAARGGNKSYNMQYSGSSNIDEVAWYYGNSGKKAHPVKTKKANELGIYDMSGNVWEWCQDWKGIYRSKAQMNPIGSDRGSDRVGRGGSWDGNASNCRLSLRYGYSPGIRYNYLGFRLALSE